MKVSTDKMFLAIANRGYSMKELSEKTGISQVTIARMKAGKQEPRPQTLGKLLKR